MRVVEIFKSIQGEGRLIGVPSIFVRFAGCNLECSWCDTAYAQRDSAGHDMAIEEISTQVKALGLSHVVLTGGEPLLQSARELEKLAHELAYRHITVETNATIVPGRLLQNAVHLWSVSPKPPSAGLPDMAGEIGTVLTSLYYGNMQVKFVVGSKEDLAWAAKIAYEFPFFSYVLQPRGWQGLGLPPNDTLEGLRNLVQWVVHDGLWPESAREVQILPQLHVLLWGQRRGV